MNLTTATREIQLKRSSLTKKNVLLTIKEMLEFNLMARDTVELREQNVFERDNDNAPRRQI